MHTVLKVAEQAETNHWLAEQEEQAAQTVSFVAEQALTWYLPAPHVEQGMHWPSSQKKKPALHEVQAQWGPYEAQLATLHVCGAQRVS